MSTLVLELRQGDMMVVNGAPIRFRNRARIELAARARFLFGKQIMAPETATTLAGTCQKLTLNLADGTSQTALFSFTK